MYTTTSVTCPWCRNGFSVPIGAKYRSAEAIPQSTECFETNIGENQLCPNAHCQQKIFVHYIR